jgi:hypothetical protein
LDHLLSLLNSTAKVGAFSPLGKSQCRFTPHSPYPLTFPRFPRGSERGERVTSVWQRAWWWLLVAIVLTAPILMLTGLLY